MIKMAKSKNFNKLERITKELKEDNESNWMKVSAFEQTIDTLRSSINTSISTMAEVYILKLLPKLSELYERPQVSQGELTFAVNQLEPRIPQEIVECALDTLSRNGKLEAEYVSNYSSLGDRLRYKIPEEKKK